MDSLISIIVPAFNAERNIASCIDSILAQTYKNTEVIIVDDGSTDGTQRICEQYAEQDIRIHRMETDEDHRGPGNARKAGCLAANGDFICFADADDLIFPTMIEKMYKKITETNADIACCGFLEDFEGGSCVKRPGQDTFYEVNEDSDTIKRLLRLVFEDRSFGAYLWNKMFRRSFLKICNYTFSEEPVFEDIDTMYRWIMQANTIVRLEEPLYRYIHHNGPSILNNWNERTSAAYRRMHKKSKELIVHQYPDLRRYMDSVLVLCASRDFKALSKNMHKNELIKKCMKKDRVYIFYHWKALSFFDAGNRLQCILIMHCPHIMFLMLLGKKLCLTGKFGRKTKK